MHSLLRTTEIRLARQRVVSWTAVILLPAGALLLAGLTGCGKPPEPPGPSLETVALTEPEIQASVLNGRWMRPDGGYVLEIRNATGSGTIEVAYFNPRPIHVAQAEASHEGSQWKVIAELRDENYPGSTYRLTYDPSDDRLKGEYYQAVEKKTFQIFFVRLKP